MILRFGVENYRCFRDRVELSFVSTARKDEPSYRLTSPGVRHGVLPVVGVWGANASGKSSLLWALRELQGLVARSFVALPPDQAIPSTPWMMATGADAPPTTLDIDVLVDGLRHHYGFSYRAAGVEQEWLYEWPGSRRRVLFHRDQTQGNPWYLGPGLGNRRGLRQVVQATRANSLFLSAAAQHNHARLGAVAAAITSAIALPTDVPLVDLQAPLFAPGAALLKPEQRAVVLSLLGAADLGVVDMRHEEHPGIVHFRDGSVGVPAASTNRLRLPILAHRGPGDGVPWEVPPPLESLGTKMLLFRLNDILPRLLGGGLLLLDEIDSSLHPDLCAELIGLFTDPATNPNGAQLLFATHSRDLLQGLRTDEVVLVEKDREGVAGLHAASDFRGLRTRDDLRRAHADGRIGGVPLLGDLRGAIAEAVRRGP